MRKALGVLALFSLAFAMSAPSASADGVVDYSVNGTWGAVVGFPDTTLSTAGDSFTLTFSVDPALLGPGPLGDSTGNIPITFNYTDFLGDTVNHTLTGQAGIVTFFTANDFGLFDIEFFPASSDDFILQLFGPDAGFIDRPTPTLNTGVFTITPGDDLGGGSSLGDFTNFAINSVTSGSVTAMPEPSSLLLLGSGFLALGSFARKRLFQRNA
jgi:PEP-CTERM motif-containing protein